MSVHMTEAKFLLLEVCTTTLSPSIWHMKKVHIPEAKFLLLKVSITTLCQNIWHMKSVHITEAKFYCLRSELLHWVPVSDTKLWVHMTKAKFLLPEVYTTTLSPSIWQWSKYLFLRPSSTTRGQYNYIESKNCHMKSGNITEAKYLLLGDSTSTLSPCMSHNDVSTHH